MYEPYTSHLERSSTAPGLAPQTERVVAAADRRSAGGQRGRRPSVDDTGPRSRPRGAPAPASTRSPAAAVCRATCLPALLHRGPAVYGFRGELWTRTRLTAVIRLECGVSYHPRHVGRLLDAIRWSPQKPARRARQRNEAAITQWRDEAWPALKRGRKRSSKPSSLWTSPAFIRCPALCAPMRRSATH